MSKTQSKKYDPNHSPVNWYIGSVILRFEELTAPRKTSKQKRELVWENTILIKAQTLQEAYSKLVAEGKSNAVPYENALGKRVRFKFEGIGFLLPIYEKLEDLTEIIWTDHGRLSDSAVEVRPFSRTELGIN